MIEIIFLLFLLLFYGGVVFAVVKLLGLKNGSGKIPLVVCVCISVLVLSFVFFNKYSGILFFLVYIIISIIFKRFTSVVWPTAIVASLFLVVLAIVPPFIYTLGTCCAGGSAGGGVVFIGWSKLQPVSPSIAYSGADDSFVATFQNTVGSSIRVTSVLINETLTSNPNDCVVNSVKGVAWTESATEVSVKAGDAFEVVADCSRNADKIEGDPFDLLITVNYVDEKGGGRSEQGHIRGPAEA